MTSIPTDNNISDKKTKGSDKGEEEDEFCPLCFGEMPKLSWRKTERHHTLCCGVHFCSPCAALLTSTHESNTEAAMESMGIPREYTNLFAQEQNCPFCRTILPGSAVEQFEQVSANAKLNKTWALFMLGMYYRDGKGTEKNDAVAFECFRKAAEAGDPDGQLELGTCYALGRGTERNMEEAMQWYERSVASGSALAQYQLGCVLRGGMGPSSVPLDYCRSFQLFMAAAEQGFPYAQCSVAHAYDIGQGVEISRERAIFWNRKAALLGNVTAQRRLAGIYLHEAADLIAAPLILFWAKKASTAGDSTASLLVRGLESVMDHKCAFCGLPETLPAQLRRCSRCKVSKYCCVEHQKLHWGVHKVWCNQVKTAEDDYNALQATREQSCTTRVFEMDNAI